LPEAEPEGQGGGSLKRELKEQIKRDELVTGLQNAAEWAKAHQHELRIAIGWRCWWARPRLGSPRSRGTASGRPSGGAPTAELLQ
jgi:hypothetical protein